MITIKRLFDFCVALMALALLCVPLLVAALAVKVTSRGTIFYWSQRVGQHNRIFNMPKFRTMRTGTPAMATHLLENPQSYLTPIGSFLRKTSVDELPQIWSILCGDMSLVGPRPALFNQYDLIALRTLHNVHNLVPGLTGWAQINGRDELSIECKVRFDTDYLHQHSLRHDVHILWQTLMQVLRGSGVSH